MKLFFTFFTLLSFFSPMAQCVTKIAFGSCAHQDHPLPIFNQIVKQKPALFIFLGDNIYGDSPNMDTLRSKYRRLERHKAYQDLKKTCPILATWDDHDYGWNDAGRHWPYKKQSKEIFLTFFGEPANSERRKHNGIYASYTFNCKEEAAPAYKENPAKPAESKTVQIILLDVRTFRDNLLSANGMKSKDGKYQLDYLPYTRSDSTLLGAEQWKWLEAELKKPADLRIIASGSQFGVEYNGYEAWANFPKEQKKLMEMIKSTKASGVLFISGDVHYAEMSKFQTPGQYPIYDCTSSGLSSTWHFACANKNRIRGPVMENNFGVLNINWTNKDPVISVELWDVNGSKRFSQEIKLSEISFPK